MKFPTISNLGDAAVSKDDVFFNTVVKNPSSLHDTIIHYNRKTKQASYLFHSTYPVASVQGLMANEKWLIWMDANDSGTMIDIYAMNRSSNNIMRISKDSSSLGKGSPFLYKDYVAWVQLAPDHTPVLKLYHLESGTLQDIEHMQEFSFLTTSVHMSEDKLVYVDRRENEAFYGLYDLHTKKKEWIPTGESYVGYPQIVQGNLVSLQFQHESSWMDQQLISYNLSNQTTTVIPVTSASGDTEVVARLRAAHDGFYISTLTDTLVHYQWKDGHFIEVSRKPARLIFDMNEEGDLVMVEDQEYGNITIQFGRHD